jgi:hypothetical protein
MIHSETAIHRFSRGPEKDMIDGRKRLMGAYIK